MINFDEVANENQTIHISQSYIPDHPYRMLIIGSSVSGKTNTLVNITNHQPDIDKVYLYAKDLDEKKYKFLVKEREDVG